jgi:hypothetical protein
MHLLQVSRKPLVCRADGFIGSTTNLVCASWLRKSAPSAAAVVLQLQLESSVADAYRMLYDGP